MSKHCVYHHSRRVYQMKHIIKILALSTKSQGLQNTRFPSTHSLFFVRRFICDMNNRRAHMKCIVPFSPCSVEMKCVCVCVCQCKMRLSSDPAIVLFYSLFRSYIRMYRFHCFSDSIPTLLVISDTPGIYGLARHLSDTRSL